MIFKIELTAHELKAFAEVTTQYFEACRIGGIEPPYHKAMHLNSVLNKLKAALNTKEGDNHGDRLHVIQPGADKPTIDRSQMVET